ncbi:MAG: hypothetical protein V4726_13270 [Verrucomicrobiota bacterium]
MPSVRPVKILLAAAILTAGGALRMPLEKNFSAELSARHLAEEPLKLSLREQLGQSVFIAVLGGFRSLVASVVELENLTAWQQGNWAKVEAAYRLCCQLQPREYHYWDFQAEANFPEAYEEFGYRDRVRSDVESWEKQKYVDRSVAVRKEALRYLPNESRLMWKLATTAQDPRNRNFSNEEAAYWFKRAYEAYPRRRFLWWAHVYCIARIPGRELEAWPMLLDMYNSGPQLNSERTATGTFLLVKIFPAVKKLKPDAELPPEVAAKAMGILQDMENKRRNPNPNPLGR